MADINQTLVKLDSFLTKKKINYAIIGGTAAIMYGRLRATEDIDVTIMVELEDMEKTHELITKVERIERIFSKKFCFTSY
jgi:predicted nucleotidyltransferase